MGLKIISGVSDIGLLVSLTFLLTLVGALDDPVLNPLLFYPFGPDVGDSVMTPNDDGSTGSVRIDVGFPFFATSNTELFVSIARGVHPPEAMMHFPLFQISLPISENIFTLRGKFSQFRLFQKNS